MQAIFVVPHTHYDVAWAFSKEEYLQINEIILKEALKLMENSNFKFCLEQAYLLMEIEKRDPNLWQKLKEKIQEGKIEIVDGQYLMPDTMLPSGEILVREILFGKRYFKDKFGIDVPVAWASDSFGMNAQLPQIYKKSGYKWLAFRRGGRADITESEFVWTGLDGSAILTHWFPLGYRAGLDLTKWQETVMDLSISASTSNILMPCGSGSMPPQPEINQYVKNWNRTHPTAQMKIATPREFFEALEGARKTFQTVPGELYDDELVDVFPQVCSSRSWIIQDLRKCKSLLTGAETFSTIAWLMGAQYPINELRKAWENILYIAFHDLVTGTGVDEIYNSVREIFLSLDTSLSQLLNQSLTYISQKVNTGGKGIIAFNPLAQDLKNWVDIDHKRGVVAELPSLGYKVFNSTPPQERFSGEILIKGTRVETPFWNLEVDKITGIVDVFDKSGNSVVKGNELIIEDEVGDLYYHRSRFLPDYINSESGEGFTFGGFKPKLFSILEEDNRVRVIFENEYYCLTWPYRMKDRFPPVLYKYKTLDIHKEIIAYRDIPRIEFITRIDNKYPNIRVRVKFDIGMERRVYFRETQFGVIAEPTESLSREGSKPLGIPNFLSWFDINDGSRGLTFMNRGIPVVEIAKNLVYITLFRSVYGLSADGTAGPLVPTPDALELRQHNYEYAIEPHQGDWSQAQMYHKAQAYTYKPIPIEADSHGELPHEFSFLKLNPDNLLLSALKKAEDSDNVILRFFETKGEATEAEISFFREIKRLALVDLLENEERELPFDKTGFKMQVKPFEIVSLKIIF